MNDSLTYERLRELLNYESTTGIWTWIKRTSNRIKVGDIAGSQDPEGYWLIVVDRKHYFSHRLAWFYMTKEWPKNQIDHRDVDPSNNKWDNLREASHGPNAANAKRRRTNTSGFKGVCFCKRARKWSAQITINKDHKNLGLFDTPKEAHSAYVKAAEEYFQEFARAA